MSDRLNDLIKNRRSSVIFSGREIENEKIRLLFESARWSSSSRNLQPWNFIIGRKINKNEYDVLFDLLNEGNQVWALHAPVLILSIAQVISDYKERPNIYAWHDTGMASACLMLQAAELGLSVHPMGGFDKVKARETLKIPEKFEPVVMFAVGYRGEPEKFEKDLQEREAKIRTRKAVNEFVHHVKWGKMVYQE